MSREIKFRAWDKTKKAWIPNPRWKICYHDVNVELMQFTGLKDKNGKEIYEGNILKDDSSEVLIIRFGKLPLDKSGDCVCTYNAFYCEDKGGLGYAPFCECREIGNWMEVIGNIHENPELLEAKQ